MLFDDIYRAIGEFGTYQKACYILLAITCIPCAWQNVAITFIGARTRHACAVPHLVSLQLPFDAQRRISIPFSPSNNSIYKKCVYYDLDYESYSQQDLVSWRREDHISELTPTKACDNGWIYDQSVFVKTAMNEWDLVCDGEKLLATIQTVYMAGVVLGCLVFGQLSDSIGRLKTLSISALLWTLCGLGSAFVNSYVTFVVLRFLTGAFVMGTYNTAFVLVIETVGPSYRMLLGILWQTWFAAGIMSLSLLSYVVRDFRRLSILISIMPAFFVSFYWLFQESPRWLVGKGRDRDATTVIRRMATLNGTEVPYNMHLQDNRTEAKDALVSFAMEAARVDIRQDRPTRRIVNYTFVDLFRTPFIRRISLQMFVVWFSISLVYYGLSLSVQYLETSLFVTNLISGAVEIPVFLTTIVLLRKVGRRWPTACAYFGAAICCFFTSAFAREEGDHGVYETWFLVFLMFGKAFSAVGFGCLYVYTVELYPTPLRSVGLGASTMFARLGGLLQPQIELLINVWVPAPFVIYGLVCALGGVVAIYFPETRDRKFPETIEEAENFRQNEALDGRVVVGHVNPHFQASRVDLHRVPSADQVATPL